MAAVWQKNEPVAAKRRVKVIVQKSDGTLAPRGTDFVTLGMVKISGVASPHFALAVGTLTNDREPLVVADDTFTADHTTETFTAVAHGLETGDGPIRVSVGGPDTLPTGLAAATDYWVIRTGVDTFMLATSLANAYAGTNLLISDNGSGTLTLSDTASTQRGLDGHFTYEATQAETNHDAPETVVIVNGVNYERSLGWGGFSTVNMASEAAAAFEQIAEGGHTYGDLIRGIARTALAKFAKAGTTYTYRDLADSKNSHGGIVDASGRTTSTITDLT